MNFIFAPNTSTTPTPATTATNDQWIVEAIATIIVPVDSNRKRCSIYHESPNDLLIDFGRAPTTSSFAFALPGNVVYVESDWVGDIRAISRAGSSITVHVRNFY